MLKKICPSVILLKKICPGVIMLKKICPGVFMLKKICLGEILLKKICLGEILIKFFLVPVEKTPKTGVPVNFFYPTVPVRQGVTISLLFK